ncbi:MAG: ABC transporter substrate-binding protein, partial [Gammaproteobacteria bacterium]
MRNVSISRRKFIAGTAAGTAAASGLLPPVTFSQEGRTLNARLVRDIQVLDPGYMIGGSEIDTQWAIFPRLARTLAGDKWRWEPSPYVEQIGHIDDTHIGFELKSGLQWSDGFGELTAEDVKFSFERLKDSEWKGKWETLDHVEITGRYSGTVVLNKPFSPIWLTAITRIGVIMCKAAFEKKGITQFTTELPAQLGPYRLREWRPKERLIL